MFNWHWDKLHGLGSSRFGERHNIHIDWRYVQDGNGCYQHRDLGQSFLKHWYLLAHLLRGLRYILRASPDAVGNQTGKFSDHALTTRCADKNDDFVYENHLDFVCYVKITLTLTLCNTLAFTGNENFPSKTPQLLELKNILSCSLAVDLCVCCELYLSLLFVLCF